MYSRSRHIKYYRLNSIVLKNVSIYLFFFMKFIYGKIRNKYVKWIFFN